MKKTLLSIMTMAILASSTAAYSNAVTKDIIVEATIPATLDMTDAQGKAINITPLKMVHDPDNGAYTITQPVRFRGNGDGLKVTMTEELKLEEKITKKDFGKIDLKLGTHDLKVGEVIDFGNDDLNKDVNLVISGKTPIDAVGGDTYSGTLKLTLEPNS
ncbi:alpha-related fimbriae minor subunit 1 [Yersinia bercovieri]|uniref:Alpha-related fimbriae minor subunit 1 n=3 Tax=Yersiniaceae TaxID=1903411 RepID=A0A2G4U1U9_YERBE|nr:CS1 type fimbrial major subunit [Yersinia bercovieri]PHZ27283.1 hypothetical protein CS533_11510 [Yersinia bercovieri]CNF64259.1 alpha-related fimbriae minor subunit 1 [Yersinia bercovieri]